MADQIQIDIYLHDTEATEKQNTNTTATTDTDKKVATKTSQNKTQKNLGKYVATKTARIFVNSTRKIISQNIGMITGKTELQERVNFALETVETGLDIVSSGAVGASIGGAVGGALGVSLALLQIGTNVTLNVSQRNFNKSIEDRQIKQLRERTGANVNNSRTGF